MIKTVHDLSEFERLTDFEQDIYFTWSTRDVGNPLPRVQVLQKLYGIEKEGAGSLVVYERLSTVTLDDAGDGPDLYDGIGVAVRSRITSFEEEVKRLADTHGCRAIAGTLEPSPVSDALSSILSKHLETLEARIAEVENNYGRALGLQESSIDRITDRLCRLESPVSADTGELRDVAVLYRCNACNPSDGLPPCICVISSNLGVPVGCIYSTGRASARPAVWQKVDQDLSEIFLDDGFQGVSK